MRTSMCRSPQYAMLALVCGLALALAALPHCASAHGPHDTPLSFNYDVVHRVPHMRVRIDAALVSEKCSKLRVSVAVVVTSWLT